jgi:hypothetical protein
VKARRRENTLSNATSHVFICFSSKDETAAREIVRCLENEGLKCWISSRDVPPGQNYQETIVRAIERARCLVFVFSENSSKSGEIKKELSLAGSFDTPVFSARLSPVMPTGALRYELATRQWIDLFPDQREALGKLAQTIRHTLDPRTVEPEGAGSIASAPTVAEKARTITARAPIVTAGTPQFESIRALLARHIGPIAKIIIEKTANEARTPEDSASDSAPM